MRELAQAQVANTAVLQQIGGRLPSPVPPSPGSHISSSHAVPAGGFGEFAAAGDYRGSPGVFGSLECGARQGTTAHVHRCVVEHQQQQLCSHEGIVKQSCLALCSSMWLATLFDPSRTLPAILLHPLLVHACSSLPASTPAFLPADWRRPQRPLRSEPMCCATPPQGTVTRHRLLPWQLLRQCSCPDQHQRAVQH